MPVLERRAGAPRPLQQVEPDRGLVREEREQIHLGERERLVVGPVEHLEHAERPLLDQQRDGHQPVRHVAGRLGGLPREAGVLLQVVDHERLPCDEHPAGDPRAGREAHADDLVLALARDRLEDELVGRSSNRKIDDAFAPKIARATSTIDCSSARCPSSEASAPTAAAAR